MKYPGGYMKQGFTLAEVLITIGIIGVVAAMTIPTLISDFRTKQLDTADKKFNAEMLSALRLMEVNNEYTKMTTSEDFLAVLTKYMKLGDKCTNNDLSKCFSEKFYNGEEEIETNSLKNASALGQPYNTNIVGFSLMNGVNVIMAYNSEGCLNSIKFKNASLTGCLAMLYDLNGKNNKGTFAANGDIRGININLQTNTNTSIFEEFQKSGYCTDVKLPTGNETVTCHVFSCAGYTDNSLTFPDGNPQNGRYTYVIDSEGNMTVKDFCGCSGSCGAN